MELVMRKQSNKKWFLIPLIVICLTILVPVSIVFALAFNQPEVGMLGVNNSSLTIGIAGSAISDYLIETRNPSLIYSDSPSYPMLIIIPLIFVVVALLLLVKMAFSDDLDLKMLIIIGIMVVIAIAMLISMQSQITTLIGG
jgi:heme/copper-type cytochrome/quinol oxidase subunit 4